MPQHRSPAMAMAAALLATVVMIPLGIAGPGHGDGAAEIGRPGDAGAADRTVEIVMGDNYFEPERITVAGGETVRFVVRNRGALLHEFNIGTAAMHAHHQEEMLAMMQQGLLTPTGMQDHRADGHMGGGHGGDDHHGHGADGHHGHAHAPADTAAGAPMTHDDPNSVLVEPGERAELVWTFPEATDLEFACNVPGHYEAGMHGDILFDR